MCASRPDDHDYKRKTDGRSMINGMLPENYLEKKKKINIMLTREKGMQIFLACIN